MIRLIIKGKRAQAQRAAAARNILLTVECETGSGRCNVNTQSENEAAHLKATLSVVGTALQAMIETALQIEARPWLEAAERADVSRPCDHAVEALQMIAKLVPGSFGECEQCHRLPALRLDDGTMRCAMRHTHVARAD